MVKRLFCWAYFRESLFSEGIIIGRKFAFQNGLGLTIKQPKTLRKQLKKLKNASTINSPWANIRKGLLSEGFLRLRFVGPVFGRAYFWEGL